MSVTWTVSVSLNVDVDPEVWADTYGLEISDTGPVAARLRDDIEVHVREIAADATARAIAAIGAGAEVRGVRI